MSLIRVRRNRKKNWIDVKKGFSTKGLIFLLILAAVAVYYLSARY
jgi:hypothetical protein